MVGRRSARKAKEKIAAAARQEEKDVVNSSGTDEDESVAQDKLMSKRKVPAKREEEHEVVTVSDSDDSQVQTKMANETKPTKRNKRKIISSDSSSASESDSDKPCSSKKLTKHRKRKTFSPPQSHDECITQHLATLKEEAKEFTVRYVSETAMIRYRDQAMKCDDSYDKHCYLTPSYIFNGAIPGSFVLDLCPACTRASSTEVCTFDGNTSKLVINVCKMCASAFNKARSVKHFHFELPLIKRILTGEQKNDHILP